jgi:hypothetical protein
MTLPFLFCSFFIVGVLLHASWIAMAQPLTGGQFASLMSVYTALGSYFCKKSLHTPVLIFFFHVSECSQDVCTRFEMQENCSGPVTCDSQHVISLCVRGSLLLSEFSCRHRPQGLVWWQFERNDIGHNQSFDDAYKIVRRIHFSFGSSRTLFDWTPHTFHITES